MANQDKNVNIGEPIEFNNIEVREMELEDLPEVYSLGEMLFTAEESPNLYRTWDIYTLVGLFASDGEYCLVAEAEGRMVGFALGSMIEKRRSAWSYGYLEWLGVNPGLKRAGIATRLVKRLTELFIEAGARIMLVDTEAENKDAIQFFKKQGFGQDVEHVYLSRNLTTHPGYVRRKKDKS